MARFCSFLFSWTGTNSGRANALEMTVLSVERTLTVHLETLGHFERCPIFLTIITGWRLRLSREVSSYSHYGGSGFYYTSQPSLYTSPEQSQTLSCCLSGSISGPWGLNSVYLRFRPTSAPVRVSQVRAKIQPSDPLSLSSTRVQQGISRFTCKWREVRCLLAIAIFWNSNYFLYSVASIRLHHVYLSKYLTVEEMQMFKNKPKEWPKGVTLEKCMKSCQLLVDILHHSHILYSIFLYWKVTAHKKYTLVLFLCLRFLNYFGTKLQRAGDSQEERNALSEEKWLLFCSRIRKCLNKLDKTRKSIFPCITQPKYIQMVQKWIECV